jgi:hypothetical protein
MRSFVILSALGLCLAAGQVSAAGCPGKHQHQKRVTISGTIVRMERVDGGYGFLTKECGDAVIFSKQHKLCRVGGKIRATGTFTSCEYILNELDELCDFDELDNSVVSCR